MVTKMKKVTYLLAALLALVIVGCGNTMVKPTTAPAGLEQSGTFSIRENQVMRLGAGVSGKGVLVFQGWEHSFSFTGAKIDVAGKDSLEIHGTVFNLETVEDFEGKYKAVKLDIESGDGLEGVWGKNEKGVTVHLIFPGHDVGIDLEATGATVTLN